MKLRWLKAVLVYKVSHFKMRYNGYSSEIMIRSMRRCFTGNLIFEIYLIRWIYKFKDEKHECSCFYKYIFMTFKSGLDDWTAAENCHLWFRVVLMEILETDKLKNNNRLIVRLIRNNNVTK